MQGYIQALKAYDPVKALQLEAATRKEATPIKLGQGDQLLDPTSFKPLATNPKDPTDKTPEAIRAIDLVYPPGTPENIKARQDYITKLKTHPQGATMNNYGSPVAGIDPTTGLPAFAVTNKTGEVKVLKDIAPPAKDVPASTREKMAENTVAIQKIDAALTDLSANPNALGAKNYIPDAIIQRTDPKGVQTRAGVADIGSQKIHDRSGASVTVSEAPRLMPFVPLVTDNPQVAETKLRRLRSEYVAMQQALQSGASIRQAVAAPKGATKTVVRTGSHNGRKVQEMSDGSIEYAD